MKKVERLSERAIAIVNALCIERLDYYSEYVPIIDALNKLHEYEEAEEAQRIAVAKWIDAHNW